MATMTIEYNSRDRTAENLIKSLLFSGVIRVAGNKIKSDTSLTRRNISDLAGAFCDENEISTQNYLARKRIDKKIEYADA
jgi:hypothetical protein